MPTVAQKMLDILGLKPETVDFAGFDASSFLSFLKGGEAFTMTEPLFQKVTPERVEELKIKYKEA